MKKLGSMTQFNKKFVGFVLLTAVILLVVRQTYAAQNFPDANTPLFSGNFAPPAEDFPQEVTVVSYNIRYAENSEQAIAELTALDSQAGVDLILLQEMDETSVEHIARTLNLNYVYFPAAVEPRYNQNFGNAILSRWPLTNPRKLILPHQSVNSQMNRIATRATIRIHEVDILVYSVHTEIFTLPNFQEDQFKAILDDVEANADFAIIGGDFNTATPSTVERLEEIFRQANIVKASNNSGHTIVKYGVEAVADHIFSKGLTLVDSGKIEQATASDHLPIWVKLEFE